MTKNNETDVTVIELADYLGMQPGALVDMIDADQGGTYYGDQEDVDGRIFDTSDGTCRNFVLDWEGVMALLGKVAAIGEPGAVAAIERLAEAVRAHRREAESVLAD